MTGFGQSSSELDGITIWAEVSSLNHRYLDMNLRLSPLFLSFENDIRKLIQSFFERGRINVLLSSEGTLPEAGEVEFNRHLAQQYLDQVRAFGVDSDLKDDLSLTSMLRLSTLWTTRRPRPEDMGKLMESTKAALDSAIGQLTKMRESEGEAIWTELSDKIKQIQLMMEQIAVRAPAVVDEFRQKLKERIDSILPQGTVLDEQRLLSEVAMFGERADITEELVRIKSHLEQIGRAHV